MLQNGLARTERTGYSGNAAARYREKRIDYALSRYERLGRRKLFFIRSAAAHGPALEHGKLVLGLAVLDDRNDTVDREAALVYLFDLARYPVRHGYPVLYDLVLPDRADDVARLHVVAFFDDGHELPFLFAVDGGRANAASDTLARQRVQLFERTLYAVVNTAYKTRSELDGERLFRRFDRLARAEHARFLIDLNGRSVAAKLYDLADKSHIRDLYDVVHLDVLHAVRHYQRSAYLDYLSHDRSEFNCR